MVQLLRPAAALVLFALPASAQGVLHVVDASGAGDFAEIWEAVDAAESRDVVLVRQGRYRGFRVEAKSLSIFAQPGHRVEISGEVEVSDLNFSEWFFMRDVHTPEDLGEEPFAFEVLLANGEAWLEGCTLRGPAGTADSEPLGAVRFVSSSNTGLVRCRATGGAARAPGAAGAPGLYVFVDIARVFDSVLVGGAGGPAPATGSGSAGSGGPGVYVDRYTAALTGCEVRGGRGGPAHPETCNPPGPGGPAVQLDNFLTEAYLLDLALTGGEPGTPLCAAPGRPGEPLEPGPAVVVEWSPEARGTEAPAVLTSGERATRRFTGLPGDHVILIESLLTDHQFEPGLFGTYVPGKPWVLSYAGLVGDAPLEQAFTAPALPGPPFEAAVLHQQAAFLGADGTVLLGSPSGTLVLTPGHGSPLDAAPAGR